jgi:hypothetical protein
MKLRNYTMVVTNQDLESGKLIVDSQAKVGKIFSVEQYLIRKNIGRVKKKVHENLRQPLFEIVS